jgi:hypothetical protein
MSGYNFTERVRSNGAVVKRTFTNRRDTAQFLDRL